MASSSFVAEVRALGRALAREIRQVPKLRRCDLDPTPQDKDRASKLLELKSLYALLRELHASGWHVTLSGRSHRPHFVSAPANKSSATYFRIEKNNAGYQIVHGTKICDRHGERRAPDISLQRQGASEDPGIGDVIAIWDAKLRGTTGAAVPERVTDAEAARFLKLMDWLEVPGVGASRVPLQFFPATFEVSGIITNGQRPSEPDTVFFEEGISVVEHFRDAQTKTHPTRAQHRVYSATGGRTR